MLLGDGHAAPRAPRGDAYRTSTSVHERSMHQAAAAHHNHHNQHNHHHLHDHHVAAVARLRAVSGLHGRRLACFRPRQRFSLRPLCRAAAAVGDHGVCACAHEPLQCRLVMASRETAPSELNGAQLRHADLARRKKWVNKFEAHDWDKHARFVCQKWRENQKKFPRRQRIGKNKGKDGMAESAVLVETSACTDDEQENVDQQDPQQQKASPSRVVKNALTSFASAAEVMVHTSKFDALLRAGVPPQLRGQVWWLCSGAAQKRAAAGPAETYAALVRKIPMLSKRAALEIEKDLPRTFPNSDTPPLTREESEAHATSMRELRRVLQAYCLRNPCVGYCQSMNFLAAVLLQYLEEEEAFWVLVVMVEDLIPQFHSKSMLGSRAEQRVFGELVQLKLPQVYEHMQALGVDFEPFTLKWFLCLFLNTLPLEPVMRVWDVFFCEGSHVLLRVGLTLLKLSQPRILACDDAIDVYEMFNFSHETLLEITAPHRNGMLNRDECVCDTLVRLAMDKSFIGAIAFDSLHELRHLYRNEVAEEVKAADERRALRESASRRPAAAASVESSNSSDDVDVDEEDEETFHLRHVEAEQELQEYDFVEEYAYHIGDVSPTKYIHFNEVRGGSAASSSTASSEEIFVDVDYDVADGPRSRATRP